MQKITTTIALGTCLTALLSQGACGTDADLNEASEGGAATAGDLGPGEADVTHAQGSSERANTESGPIDSDTGDQTPSGEVAGDDATAAEEEDTSSPEGEADSQGPVTPPLPGPIAQASHWCEAALGGPEGTRAFAQDLARAHVSQRLFGPSADWLGADATLVGLLANDQALDSTLLSAYGDAFSEVCALNAEPPASGEASLNKQGTVAIITPGSGSVTLPSSATHVVLDLRTPASDEAVRAALALAISGELTLATRRVRQFHGFPAQDDGWTHYEVFDDALSVTISGTGDKDLPLIFWTPKALSAEVATLVGALRLMGRASIVGHHVYAAVAESSWSGIEGQGLLWRASTLETQGARWPDLIEATLETNDLETLLESVEALGDPPPVVGDALRPELMTYDRGAGKPDAALDRGTMRAALLVAYGTLDMFYGYFHLVGRDLDDALLEALDEVDTTSDGDRLAMKHIIGRFMHDLYDGHGFYWDDGSESWPDGWMALQIQQIDGLPVVRSSLSPGLFPGDTVLAVDGLSITDWYAEAMSRYSASSDGYRFVLATDELKEIYGAPEWTVRGPDGVERSVTAQASEWEDVESVAWGGSLRPSGWLSDLGAPDVYFVNMASAVTPDVSGVVAELASAGEMAGVILDMRDYPHLDIYEFARTFNPAHFSAPLFGFPTWRGPFEYAVEFEAWEFDPAPHVVDAPVVLMVSNKSVSAAECFSQMVMALDNVTVVGQQSASTNGTITTFWLPGRFELTFTGMELTNPDGSDFHGIGVVPDVEVTPTPADFAAGEDPELNAALEVLGGTD